MGTAGCSGSRKSLIAEFKSITLDPYCCIRQICDPQGQVSQRDSAGIVAWHTCDRLHIGATHRAASCISFVRHRLQLKTP
mmetsp:Transcript_105071/g.208879  ORF Transcript_105071/g.208879 Transcript_105071/m.208879 type:complete len:80 (-) Transcript_105071:771-1010(-)